MSVQNKDHRTYFTDISTSLNLLATDTPTTVGAALVAGKTNHTIYIQRIKVHVRTAAAQALTFQDNALTPKIIAVLPASAAAGDIHTLLDTEEGVPLTEGKQLDLTGVAGVAGMITIEGFRKASGVMSADTYASA